MAMDLEAGAAAFKILATHLRTAGEGGLKRDLYQAINDAAKPLAREIADLEHLKPYMPDRYAAILSADLSVKVSRRAGADPGISLRAAAPMQARQGRRKVGYLDKGFINHPVYARGARSDWAWSNSQTGGMKAGFFTDPTQHAAPQVRAAILTAMTAVADKVTRRT